LEKSDGLIRMRIDLLSNQSFDQSFVQPLDVWHAPLSPAAFAHMKPSDTATDIKTKLAFDLRLRDKLIEIVTPAAILSGQKAVPLCSLSPSSSFTVVALIVCQLPILTTGCCIWI
jgi:hypothetical protein